MILLAIDPSLSSTGFAVFDEDGKLIEYGKQTTGYTTREEDRMCKIANKMKALIEKYKIEVVVMETQFFSKNAKTSMQLSRLRGAITYVCRGLNVDMEYLTPAEARKLLMGLGSSKKEDIANYIRGNVVDLGPLIDRTCKEKNSDIYDSIGIGLAFLNKGEE